ncbi:1-deoxy-D-xylulose-5-phosphate reductoisomerase [Desulfurivibrio dismutans]|uniref:1-deoxy-D-xylulose-5-phosphate reductoisomerase n=1 Tax=Desulfurivibrio dismutans TaxID=1398908 RepID=UPI0023DC482B|nr:1-deoxy-D-xylulose-5-phosphate reductoisomerase [Desulfurivibrio alkaliphilus]MDF1614866.1 1-deoxy-D-xylulose-5-phosphate reductoisomerase [Desulfurivibrio alkaliphilus]
MTKNISLLGSTGSIGCNVLDVVRQYPGRFRVVGMAAGGNIRLLREQIEAFHPLLVSVADDAVAGELIQSLPPGWGERVLVGRAGNEEVAALDEADLVVSAIVGAAGLTPTMAGIEAGKDIALANKETLVMAGELVMNAVARKQVQLLPIDSEHNAIAQSLSAGRHQDIHRLILTASGGPFRDKSTRDLWEVTPEQALNHPNWSMGRKISIDSATLMNKGLEVIEAHWLFGVPVEKIEVLIHPQSIVHSMVEYIDGSVISQMGIPDMRVPIVYALSYPERLRLDLPRLNLTKTANLSFFPPDFTRFPALELAYKACKRGGTRPAALNAANEVAVEAFLQGKIRFPEIALVVTETVNRIEHKPVDRIATVLAVDLAARMMAESVVESLMIKAKQKRNKVTP